jgi:hypothetical protein
MNGKASRWIARTVTLVGAATLLVSALQVPVSAADSPVCLTPEPAIIAPPGAHALALTDFNKDGKLDFVSANGWGSSVSVRLGNGSGFTSPSHPDWNMPAYSSAVAVGDFNNDGNMDFVVANSNEDSVGIRLGDGTGGFTVPIPSLTTVQRDPIAIAVGDLNFDGKLDFVTASYNDTSIAIRLGDGAGHFSPGPVDTLKLGGRPMDVAVADVDGDRKPDILVTSPNEGRVTIFLGKGDGTFGFLNSYIVGVNPWRLVLGDINTDGKIDFVTVNRGHDSTYPTADLLSGIDGSASPRLNAPATIQKFVAPNPTEVSVAYHPVSIALADLNWDGHLDIVTVNYFGRISAIPGQPLPAPFPVPPAYNLSIRFGDGAGHFTTPSPVELPLESVPLSIVAGDLNGDGKSDLLWIHQADSSPYGDRVVSLLNCHTF